MAVACTVAKRLIGSRYGVLDTCKGGDRRRGQGSFGVSWILSVRGGDAALLRLLWEFLLLYWNSMIQIGLPGYHVLFYNVSFNMYNIRFKANTASIKGNIISLW